MFCMCMYRNMSSDVLYVCIVICPVICPAMFYVCIVVCTCMCRDWLNKLKIGTDFL